MKLLRHDFVYGHHEGFTQAFTKAFGISPKRFSSIPEPNGWIIPYLDYPISGLSHSWIIPYSVVKGNILIIPFYPIFA